MSFLFQSISPQTRKNDATMLLFVVTSILDSVTKKSKTFEAASLEAYNGLMKQLNAASSVPAARKSQSYVDSLRKVYEIGQCVQIFKFGSQNYAGPMSTLNVGYINEYMASITAPLVNISAKLALDILLTAFKITVCALLASLSLVAGTSYVMGYGVGLLANSALPVMSEAISKYGSSAAYAASGAATSAARSASAAYSRAVQRDEEHNAQYARSPKDFSAIGEQEMIKDYLNYGQALQLSEDYFGRGLFESGAAQLERIWTSVLLTVQLPSKQQLLQFANNAYMSMVELIKASPQLLQWSASILSYFGSLIKEAAKSLWASKFIADTIKYSEIAYNNFVIFVQTIQKAAAVQLLTFGNEIIDVLQFITIKKSLIDAESIYSYSESFVDMASIFKDSAIEEANKMKVLIFIESMKRLKDLREISTILTSKLYSIQSIHRMGGTQSYTSVADMVGPKAQSAAAIGLVKRKRIGGPFSPFIEQQRMSVQNDLPEEPFLQCIDIYRMEPYINFFDATNNECRLYNDHGEYLAPKMDSGLPLIVPQELVEYLNIRTTYREFERPELHIFAGSMQSTITLNGIKDSAEPEYQHFMNVFYKPGCSFCLKEGSYTLDHEALLRFPYLDPSFPTEGPNYKRGTFRDYRRTRYLKDPAPSIAGDESNGMNGRKYKELSTHAEKDKYFQHFMFPIRDIIETEAMTVKRKALSPESSRSRSHHRLFAHQQIDQSGRGTNTYYGRMNGRLGSFERLRGGGGIRGGIRGGAGKRARSVRRGAKRGRSGRRHNK